MSARECSRHTGRFALTVVLLHAGCTADTPAARAPARIETSPPTLVPAAPVTPREHADALIARLVTALNARDSGAVAVLSQQMSLPPDTASAARAIADFVHLFEGAQVTDSRFLRQHGGEGKPVHAHFEYRLHAANDREKTVAVYYDGSAERFRVYDELLGYSGRAHAFVDALAKALREQDAARLARLLNPDDIDYPEALARQAIGNYARTFDLPTLAARFDGLAPERENPYAPSVDRAFRFMLTGTRAGANVEHPVTVTHGDGLVSLHDDLVPANPGS